jgi:hypothetical protein
LLIRAGIREDLVLIDLGKELRRARQQGGEEPGKLGPLARGGQELVGVLGQERGIPACAILQHERHAQVNGPRFAHAILTTGELLLALLPTIMGA